MSAIQDEIDRIKKRIEEAYTELKNKGVEIPTDQTSDNLAAAISSIDAGNASVTYHPSTHILEITMR